MEAIVKGPPAIRMMTKTVANIARRSFRLRVETSTPADSEKSSVLRKSRAIRPTSPGVTQPRRQRQDRHRSKQAVENPDRRRDQLPQDHVVALQIRKEEQPDGPLALFRAQAVRRGASPGEQAISKGERGQGAKEPFALAGRQLGSHHREPEGRDGDRDDRCAEPPSIRRTAARGHTQLPGNDGQESHLKRTASR